MQTANAPEPDEAAARADQVDVPDGVRHALVTLAAQVLGALEPAEVPTALRQVRRFAPRRRAQAGATPLWTALEQDEAFRLRAATAWSQAQPELAAALLARGADAVVATARLEPPLHAAAVGAWLLRAPGWAQVMARAADAEDAERSARDDDADLVRLRARAERAEIELARLRTELVVAQAAAASAAAESSTLRRDARRLRADADRARAQARTATDEAAAERLAAERALVDARAHADRAASLAARAEDDQHAARAARALHRDLASVRVRLLLDTIVDAGSALRDELALPPAGTHPADLVAPPQLPPTTPPGSPPGTAPGPPSSVVGPGTVPRPSRGRSSDDPGFLDELLALPHVHLVVDGYNVSMTGYAGLPLEVQRRRLVDALATVAVRTGAEVTCCFDGQDVGWVPSLRTRSVRVLFSSGEIADDLIRRLVRAEPAGRVVVVASSDQEVARDVQAMGASSVSSRALLERLTRW